MRPKAILDTNVLVPAPLRDLFLRLDIEGLITVVTSEPILEELPRALSSARPDLDEQQRQRAADKVRRQLGGNLADVPTEMIDKMQLDDLDDRHVAVAAHQVGATIVTYNLKDFPGDYLRTWNLTALSPDAFLLSIAKRSPLEMLDVLQQQAQDFGKFTRDDLLHRLEQKERLAETATYLRVWIR